VAIRNSLWFGMLSSGTQKLAAINIQRNPRDRNIHLRQEQNQEHTTETRSHGENRKK
jgi:hypothetical protein